MTDSHGTALPIASIVIPAHNEEMVLARNLELLLGPTAAGEFDVVVVPNGCSDRTAEVARDAGVRVVETPISGKAHALRLGDAACVTFPRIYLDADVELSAAAARALVAACNDPAVLACAPEPILDLTGTGWFVRRVHKVHEKLIASRRGLAGAGAYVLTRRGHGRAFPIPDVISDDGWVHGSFAPDERVVVRQAQSVVRPAGTVRTHLNRRLRVRRGNRQLVALGRAAPEGPLRAGGLVGLIRARQASPVDAFCYLAMLSLDRFATATRRRQDVGWGTDGSTRLPAKVGSGEGEADGVEPTHAA
jgi:hypothetical protein